MTKQFWFIVFLVTLLALVLYGCGDSEEQATNLTPVPIEEVQQPVVVQTSCDDYNPCTEDVFNNLTRNCEYRRMTNCCGDGTCTGDERCDASTHATKCLADCRPECPAFLVVSDWGCEGECLKAGTKYIVEGDSKFTLTLENIGELPLTGITSNFRCNRVGGSNFYSSNTNTVKEGVSFRGYFSGDSEERTSLTGVPYGRNNAIYTFEVSGEPESNIELKCTVGITAPDVYYPAQLSLSLSAAQ